MVSFGSMPVAFFLWHGSDTMQVEDCFPRYTVAATMMEATTVQCGNQTSASLKVNTYACDGPITMGMRRWNTKLTNFSLTTIRCARATVKTLRSVLAEGAREHLRHFYGTMMLLYTWRSCVTVHPSPNTSGFSAYHTVP